jgi:hypothetical protein
MDEVFSRDLTSLDQPKSRDEKGGRDFVLAACIVKVDSNGGVFRRYILK